MTRQELLDRLTTIEWDDFEVKESRSELPKNIWETVSAFSNTAGGWIVLGVAQKGGQYKIVGLDNPEKIEQDFYSTLRGSQKFNAPIDATITRFGIDGKIVFAIYIPLSSQKPVYFNSLQNTFIRNGSGDQRATEYERNAMFRNQSFGMMSGKVVPETSFNDLNKSSFESYRRYLKGFNENLKYNNLDDTEFCEKLQITKNGSLTYGGLLMFGNELSIGHHFADFRIDYFEIPGTSYANATNRYTFRISEMENIWEYYLAIIQRLRLYADNVFVGINQMGVGIEESPKLDALREALVNMLMHADYFSPMKSRIRVFTDRIEFENPGGFPRPIDELLRTDVSIPRNPVIAKLFRCAKLCENAGFGFDKMQQWNEEDSKLVSFRDEKMDCALVVFGRLEVKRTIIENPPENPPANPPANPPEKLDDLDVLIVSLLKDNPKITYDKLSDMTGKHRDTIRVHLNTLREKGILVRVGPDKGGHWNVVEPLRATTNNIQTP